MYGRTANRGDLVLVHCTCMVCIAFVSLYQGFTVRYENIHWIVKYRIRVLPWLYPIGVATADHVSISSCPWHLRTTHIHVVPHNDHKPPLWHSSFPFARHGSGVPSASSIFCYTQQSELQNYAHKFNISESYCNQNHFQLFVIDN